MKEKLKRSLALMFVVLLSLSNFNIVSAHSHTYTLLERETDYEPMNDANHLVTVCTIYKCSCGDIKRIYNDPSSDSHTYSGYSYTGYNYHSGTKHSFEYARYCSYCSHKQSYMDTINCGGPPCVVPYYLY